MEEAYIRAMSNVSVVRKSFGNNQTVREQEAEAAIKNIPRAEEATHPRKFLSSPQADQIAQTAARASDAGNKTEEDRNKAPREAQKREGVPKALNWRSARAGKVRMPKKAPENPRRPWSFARTEKRIDEMLANKSRRNYLKKMEREMLLIDSFDVQMAER